uniref:Uncharacterized protein n=1 Tax=Bionectria ochroleuca TaxID=29856 RepID=A0A8H7KBK8_BIOOC
MDQQRRITKDNIRSHFQSPPQSKSTRMQITLRQKSPETNVLLANQFTAFRHTLEATSHRSHPVRQTQLTYHTDETTSVQRLHVTRNMTIPPPAANTPKHITIRHIDGSTHVPKHEDCPA